MKKDWFMLFIAVMFSLVLWPMALWFSYGWWQQSQTTAWPAADEAEVMSSRVVSRSGRKSTTHKPEVKYRYRVGDKWHIDERVSLCEGLSYSGRGYAQTVVSAHPAGKKITVYVDPSDWTRSVLLKGLNDGDWRTLAFMAPFAVIPVVVWGVYIGSIIRGGKGHAGTVRVFEPAPSVSVFRDIGFGPWALAIGTLAGGLILTTIFVLGFVATNTRDILLTCFGGTVLVAVAAAMARRQWIKSGRKDGVIDLNAGTLSLARGWKREPVVIELARVIETTLRQDSTSSTNRRPHWRVHLVLDGEAETRPIADISHKADARDFENWVRERVALEKKPVISRERRTWKEAAALGGDAD